MAGSISLLHEAVRLEANRENFKALTKYLGALAAVSHALLEICENGSDSLYTSVFEEKLGIVNRCYDRITFLFADLTKPDPPSTTTIASSAGVLAIASRRNSRASSVEHQNLENSTSSKRFTWSNGSIYENIPANGNGGKYEKKSEKDTKNRRYRHHKTISNGSHKKMDSIDQSVITPNNRLAISNSFKNNDSTVERISLSPASPTSPPWPENGPTSRSPMTLSLVDSMRIKRASYDHNSNFGTILTALNLQGQSTFYDVPTSTQNMYSRLPYQTLGGEYDSDIEADRELPQLQDIFGIEPVRNLIEKERKRQQAIIELFHIERMHVGRLKVMYRVFYKPLSQNQLLSRSFVDLLPLNMLQLVFANLEEILQVHMAINRAMKAVLKEHCLVAGVGDLMTNFLDNTNGNQLKNAAIIFCQYQQYALDMLRSKRKEDKKFCMFLEKAETNPMCRGFPLRDVLPGEMKHLSRYPLLLENILKYTPEHWDETRKLRHCVKCAKDILHAVNIAKRNFDNIRKLSEIRDKLDLNPFYMTEHEIVSAYPNFDLTKYNLIFEGNLKWRIGKKTIDIYTIVLDSVLLLLTITDFDRYRMMFYEIRIRANGRNKKMEHVRFSPLLELAKLNPRASPIDERAFYLICKIPPYAFTYELVAPSLHERRTWLKMIGDQSDICKRQDNVHISSPLRSRANIGQETHSQSSSFSSGNDSQENYYEKIDTCSSCSSESDLDLSPSMDDHLSSTFGNRVDYGNVPSTSQPSTNASIPSSTRRSSNTADNFDLHRSASPCDFGSLIDALCTCERIIFQEMQKRQEILARMFDLTQDDFTNMADLITSLGGPKTLTECVLVATDEVNKLLSLIHWNGITNPRHSTADHVRSSASSPLCHTNWIQHCLAPNFIPGLLALMRYMSTMLRLIQGAPIDPLERDAFHVKL